MPDTPPAATTTAAPHRRGGARGRSAAHSGRGAPGSGRAHAAPRRAGAARRAAWGPGEPHSGGGRRPAAARLVVGCGGGGGGGVRRRRPRVGSARRRRCAAAPAAQAPRPTQFGVPPVRDAPARGSPRAQHRALRPPAAALGGCAEGGRFRSQEAAAINLGMQGTAAGPRDERGRAWSGAARADAAFARPVGSLEGLRKEISEPRTAPATPRSTRPLTGSNSRDRRAVRRPCRRPSAAKSDRSARRRDGGHRRSGGARVRAACARHGRWVAV
jgi:hypothetical protein